MKTGVIVAGALAAGVAIWWFKFRKAPVATETTTTTVSTTTGVPAVAQGLPTSPVALSAAAKNPGTLIAPTSGNTGIVPPVLTPQVAQKQAAIKTIAPIAPAVMPIRIGSITYKPQAIQGLGCFLMN